MDQDSHTLEYVAMVFGLGMLGWLVCAPAWLVLVVILAGVLFLAFINKFWG